MHTTAEDVEKPLHEKIVTRQDVEFKRLYNFNPLGWLKPSEKTKARVYRWLQPSGHKEVFPMECIKCHERPVKHEEKKTTPLSNGFELVQV